jgi:hypothetical protein
MGMTLTKDKHDSFHREGRDLTPEKHAALMKRLGISEEQDREWHRTHLTLGEQRLKGAKGLRAINPFAVGGGFLSWCIRQGWVVQSGRQYFATKEGAHELRERFQIKVQPPR